ncbi:MAG: response regulator [Solirubrobacteraceae bacterium]
MNRKILVIDDSELVREAAAIALGRVGWEVETQPDGEEGLAAARRQPPDAILLDVIMPGPDGRATLQRLQGEAATRDIPVAFLTARDDEAGALLALGARAVIAKPFALSELAGQVREAFGWEP